MTQEKLIDTHEGLTRDNYVMREMLKFVKKTLNDKATYARHHTHSDEAVYIGGFCVQLMADLAAQKDKLLEELKSKKGKEET